MQVNLIVLVGKHRGETIMLPPTQFVIGRDDSCHLRPVSKDVSKFHCAVARMGERILLRDLKSTNGTFLNEQRVTGTVRLGDGDLLQVGPLKFLIQIVQDAAMLPGTSELGWLLRSPDEHEKKVLDSASDTGIFRGPLPPEEAQKPLPGPEGATAVAGRFLRDYLDNRKRRDKK
jgi:predicted component of type VI protein secretion system